MSVRAIAILSPGIMGAAVGGALRAHGHDVLTCLAGRGEATRARAARLGLREVATLEQLAEQSDLVLSILPPESARATARAVAAAMMAAKKAPPFADMNAISPETTRAVAAEIARAGAPFIDGGIIGSPPGQHEQPPRFYVSGPEAKLFDQLDGKGIAVRQCGAEIGRASAIKMVYAGVTKGVNTLYTAALVAAEALGVGEDVRKEFAYSHPAHYKAMQTVISRLPADSGRWIGEMEEIAATFAAAGVTPQFHNGAKWVFELLNRTPYAAETRETMDRSRTLEQSIATYAQYVKTKQAAE